ncbi:MAG: hypothetical protein ACKVOS_04350 [Sphingorhabdus sp.]
MKFTDHLRQSLIIAGNDGYNTAPGNPIIGHRGVTLSAGQEYFESDN